MANKLQNTEWLLSVSIVSYFALKSVEKEMMKIFREDLAALEDIVG